MPPFIDVFKSSVVEKAQNNYEYDDHSEHKEKISEFLANPNQTKHLLIKPDGEFAAQYFKSPSGALFLKNIQIPCL